VGADEALSKKGAGGSGLGAGEAPGVVATVVEERPALIYVVRLPTGQQVLAHAVGTVERNFVRLVPGDRVEIALMPHDPARGRIVRKVGSRDSSPTPNP
jgi:translation initiation factor IF-1